MSHESQARTSSPDHRLDALVVGAGFAGLYMLHKLRQLGLRARVLEAADGIGGTWYWNRYPGARCDVESFEYSYSFSDELQQEWEWSERYPAQPEILRYLEHVADRFDLRADIQLGTRVAAAAFDEASAHWLVTTTTGETWSARFCVMATGCLSVPTVPRFEGLASFPGDVYHTGTWPKEAVDLSGRQVAVIGTGSSGIQLVPAVAPDVARLLVFQRTPNFSVPARNAPLGPEERRRVKAGYGSLRAIARTSAFGLASNQENAASAWSESPEARTREYQRRWDRGGICFLSAYGDLLSDPRANQTAAEFVRDKIRELVRDPRTAARLTPTDHPIGTKRLCVDSGYYAAFNRPNVELIDLREEPIRHFTPSGLETTNGSYAFDAVVLATGFDAMTGALQRIDVQGRNGVSLADHWASGPRTYLGLAVAGFPNLFLVTGPGSPSVLSNMVVSIEQHVEWIAGCLAYLQRRDMRRIETTAEAEKGWVEHVRGVASSTLFPMGASWYRGANIEGKARVFMPYVGGVAAYGRVCQEVAAGDYAGFVLG